MWKGVSAVSQITRCMQECPLTFKDEIIVQYSNNRIYWDKSLLVTVFSVGNWRNSLHWRLTGERWNSLTSDSPIFFASFFTNFVCKFQQKFHLWNGETFFTVFLPFHRSRIPHPTIQLLIQNSCNLQSITFVTHFTFALKWWPISFQCD